MDLLSDAVSTMRLGRSSSDRVRMGGTWAVHLPLYEGVAFLAVLEGECWLLPENGDPILVATGDTVLILPRGKRHVISNIPDDHSAASGLAMPFEQWHSSSTSQAPPDGAIVDVICGKYGLDVRRLHPLLDELPDTVHVPGDIDGRQELHAAILLLANEQMQARAGSVIALSNLLDLLLVYIVRAWMNVAGNHAWPNAFADPVTSAALRALHADPAGSWTNDRLATTVGVSRPTLARRFAALVGTPPMAYLTWWRLVRAATLLLDTQDTIEMVAKQVGYSSAYALTHAFEREFATTPGRYRTQMRNNPQTHPRPRTA